MLDDINGVGPKRRRALMKKFKSRDELKKASVEELLEAEGMNTAAAQAVYDFFHEAQK